MESSYSDIKNSDFIGYADMLWIVFDDKCVEMILDHEHCLNVLKFTDVLEEAKKNGYRDGTITLVAESPLGGKVYRYGNYGDYWVKHGTTCGYA